MTGAETRDTIIEMRREIATLRGEVKSLTLTNQALRAALKKALEGETRVTLPGNDLEPLTVTQRKVLNFIINHIKTEELPPTVREIGERFGWSSSNNVAEHLKRLEKKGYILRKPRTARSIRVLVTYNAD